MKYWYVIAFIFLHSLGYSQNKKESNLIVFLQQVEEVYKIDFNFADDNIPQKKISNQIINKPLFEIIHYLENNFQLQIIEMNDTNYAILKKGIVKEIDLDDILIPNYISKGISLKKDGTIQINSASANIFPGLTEPDVLHTLQHLPGISSANETVSTLNVRGGTYDQNLLLWDGIKMYQSSHFFGMITAFNPYLIKEVKVTKNGTSASFGDGISSTIEMNLANKISDDSTYGFGVNFLHTDAFAKIQLNKKVEMQFFFRKALTDFINTPTYSNYFDKVFQDTDITNNDFNYNKTISNDIDFNFYDYGGKIIYKPSDKNLFTLSIIQINNDLNYTESSEDNEYSKKSNSKLSQHNFGIGINYLRKWNDKIDTSLQLLASTYKLQSQNNDLENNQILEQNNEVFDIGLKSSLHVKLNTLSKLNMGYQFNEIAIKNKEVVSNPSFFSKKEDVLRSHVLFSELIFTSKNNKTNAKVGVRLSYIPKFNESILEPRLSVNKKISKYFRLSLLGEFKSQTTSQVIDMHQDFLGVEKRRWVLSNKEDLPIIKSKQASFSLQYKKQFLVDLSVFYKQIDNVSSKSQGFQNQFQLSNEIGEISTYGLDFLLSKKINKWNVWFGYTWSNNDYLFDNLNQGIAFPNNIEIKHDFTLASHYANKKWIHSFGLKYRSGKPTTDYSLENPLNGIEVNFEQPNAQNLASFFRADASSTYKFDLSNKINGRIGLSLSNVFNTENDLNRYHVVSSDNTRVESIINKSLKITPNVSMRLFF